MVIIMVNLHSIWLPAASPSSSASLQDIQRWESYYGLQLPTMVKALLSVHDGGTIDRMGMHFDILPLEQIRPLSEASMRELFWTDSKSAMSALCEGGVPVLWLVFPIARDDLPRVHLLCYTAHSIKAEPLLFEWDHGSARRLAISPDEFLDQLVQVSDFSAVDLAEMERMEVSADTSLEYPHPRGGITRVRQVIGRIESEWTFLRTEEVVVDEVSVSERRWRYAMGPSLCLQACHVSHHRTAEPGFDGSWALALDSAKPEDMTMLDSYRTAAGQWQSRERHGSPTEPPLIEALSEQELCDLRQKLVGQSPGTPSRRMFTDAPNAVILQPDAAAVTQSLRKITDGALRAARSRLLVVAGEE
jgi:hypothetical protein